MRVFGNWRRAALCGAVLAASAGCGAPVPDAAATSHAANGADGANGAGDQLALVHRDPDCGCCTQWNAHLRENGFEVQDETSRDMMAIKERLRVPAQLRSCHTAEVGGYVIEGHVPADIVQRLLAERPSGVAGLAVPGMPIGSPGMEVPGRPAQSYDIVAWDETGKTWIFDQR